jgi:hypothetical protein
MDPYEEQAETLLRLLRADRAELANQIVTGGVSLDNVAGGYREATGRILQLDRVIEQVMEVFRGVLPEAPKHKPKPRSAGY